MSRPRPIEPQEADASDPKASVPVVASAVLILAIACLLGAELAVRLFLPFATPETLRAYSLEYEPSPYTRLQFARSGRLIEVDPTKAWGVVDADAPSERSFFINDLGFRGPEFAPSKSEGVTRVFVLGGSSVFDQNVSDRSPSVGRSWPNRAQALLRARGFNVEVINAGTPSHSTIDVLGRLTSEIWLYEPDIVVLYSAWNDIKHFRAAEIAPDSPLSRLVRPYDPDADPYRNYRGLWDRMLSRSQLYMTLRFRYLSATVDAGAEGWIPSGVSAATYGSFGPRQYEFNLRNFVDVARNIGARPVLSTQVGLGREAEDGRIAYEYQLLDPVGLRRAYAEVDRIARKVARDEGVPLLDAARDLEDRPSLLSDHVHLSPEGSEALANLLAGFLVSLLDPQERTGG